LLNHKLKLEMELNFDDILTGKDVKPVPSKPQEDKKLKQTDTRARQQSCMIHEVDKDLVTSIFIQLPAHTKPVVENFRVSLSDMLSLVPLL